MKLDENGDPEIVDGFEEVRQRLRARLMEESPPGVTWDEVMNMTVEQLREYLPLGYDPKAVYAECRRREAERP